MVTMSLERKKTLTEKLARKAGRLAGFLSFHAPRVKKAAGEKAKKAYEKSISAYEKSITFLEKAKREQARIKRLTRRGKKALKGTKRKHRKMTRHVKRKR